MVLAPACLQPSVLNGPQLYSSHTAASPGDTCWASLFWSQLALHCGEPSLCTEEVPESYFIFSWANINNWLHVVFNIPSRNFLPHIASSKSVETQPRQINWDTEWLGQKFGTTINPEVKHNHDRSYFQWNHMNVSFKGTPLERLRVLSNFSQTTPSCRKPER